MGKKYLPILCIPNITQKSYEKEIVELTKAFSYFVDRIAKVSRNDFKLVTKQSEIIHQFFNSTSKYIVLFKFNL